MIVFSLLAILALVFGALIFSNAQSAIHEIEGCLCFIVAAMLCASALLATINDKLAAIHSLFRSARDDHDIRAKARAGVTTERWELLQNSLAKLDGTPSHQRPLTTTPEFDPLAEVAPPQTLKAKCAKCGKTVKTKLDWAGRDGKCPACGSTVGFPIA